MHVACTQNKIKCAHAVDRFIKPLLLKQVFVVVVTSRGTGTRARSAKMLHKASARAAALLRILGSVIGSAFDEIPTLLPNCIHLTKSKCKQIKLMYRLLKLLKLLRNLSEE